MNKQGLIDIAIVLAILAIITAAAANLVFKKSDKSDKSDIFDKTLIIENFGRQLEAHIHEENISSDISFGFADDMPIKINGLMDFNGKTKDQIMNIRGYYLRNSISNKEILEDIIDFDQYTPNEYVFGKIADDKPWIGIRAATCNWTESTTKEKTEGDSEESVFIDNPLALVMIEMPYYTLSLPQTCDEKAYLVPTYLTYSKSMNTFTLRYNISEYQNVLAPENRNIGMYSLKSINARDLGYNWVYAYEAPKIVFYSDNGIDIHPYKFKDFIHVGSSCEVQGGCNNGSPYQPEVGFAFKKLPAKLRLKLWKDQPKSPSKSADVYYDIVFE